MCLKVFMLFSITYLFISHGTAFVLSSCFDVCENRVLFVDHLAYLCKGILKDTPLQFWKVWQHSEPPLFGKRSLYRSNRSWSQRIAALSFTFFLGEGSYQDQRVEAISVRWLSMNLPDVIRTVAPAVVAFGSRIAASRIPRPRVSHRSSVRAFS